MTSTTVAPHASVPRPGSVLPTAQEVFLAARRIRDVVRRTPLRRSAELSRIAGGDVYLKLESEQVTGSFKLRGAFNAIAALPPEVRSRGVITSSAGNHGLGVAFAARHFGITATIFIPSSAPRVKKEGILALGATVDETRPDYDSAAAAAHAYAESQGVRYINPCAGDDVLAGQGTVALEVLLELPEVASLVVPVGGGGLVGGIASLVRRVAPGVRIVGAQSAHTAAMARSLEAGRLVEIPIEPTLADGLSGQVDDYALAVGREAVDELAVVSEDELAGAIDWLARAEGVTAEGAGAAAPGAVLARRVRSLPTPAVAVVSGRNIDQARLAEVLGER